MTKSFQFLFLPSELQHGGFARMAGKEIWVGQHQSDSIQTISLCFTILWFLRRRIFQLSQSHLLNNSTDGGFVGLSWLDASWLEWQRRNEEFADSRTPTFLQTALRWWIWQLLNTNFFGSILNISRTCFQLFADSQTPTILTSNTTSYILMDLSQIIWQ